LIALVDELAHSVPENQLYCWGGKHRRLPQSFEFPRVVPRVMFQLWQLGDPQKKYPPLCTLTPVDLGDDSVREQKNKRRRLADLRSLMSEFENAISKKDCRPRGPLNVANVNEMFDAVAKEVLKIPDRTPTGRKRLNDQAVWTTVVREGWSTAKRGAEKQADGDDSSATDGE